MRHITPLSRHAAVPEKASILSVMAQLQNLLSAIVTLQELQDLLTKSDTHDNS